MLNEVWTNNQTPDLETRKLLAEKIGGGATARTMYVWFQNRRAEAKRKQSNGSVSTVAGSADVDVDMGATGVASPMEGGDNVHLHGGTGGESLVPATQPGVEGDPGFQFPSGSDAADALVAMASFSPATPAPAENSRPESSKGQKRPAASPSEAPSARKVRRYTPEELELLSDVYRREKNPDLETRKKLAERIGNDATPEKIYSWFHNRRAEERRKQILASAQGHVESMPEHGESMEDDSTVNVGPKSEAEEDLDRDTTAGDAASASDAGQMGTPAPRQVRLFTPEQLAVLEKIWEETEDPDLTCRKRLADELQVTPRHVYLWFKRRRVKLHPQVETPMMPRRRGRRSAGELAAAAASASSASTASASASGVLGPPAEANDTALTAEGLSFQLSLDTQLRAQLATGNMDKMLVMLQRKDVPGTQRRVWSATQNLSMLPGGGEDAEYVVHTVMHPGVDVRMSLDENTASSVSGRPIGLAGGDFHEIDTLPLSGDATQAAGNPCTQGGDLKSISDSIVVSELSLLTNSGEIHG